MRSLWAAGLLLRRLRTERGIIVLIVVLVAATSFVFAAGPRLFNRVADDGLRYAGRLALPAQRNLTLSLISAIPPTSAGGVSGVRAYGEKIAAPIPASINAVVSERTLLITTVRFSVPHPPSYETHISLRYEDGLTDATKLVSGRWPVDRGVQLRAESAAGGPTEPPGSPEPESVILEAALSTAEADEVGVHLGDRLAVVLDGSDPQIRGTAYRVAPFSIDIVGLFEPIDPNAEYWQGDPALLHAEQVSTDPDTPIAYVTAYIPAEAYPNVWSSGLPFHYEWRYHVDPQALDSSRVAQLQVDLRRLGLVANAPGEEGSDAVVVQTGLARIVDTYAGQRALSEAVLSIAAIGPFGLAVGAMAMVAVLLVRRRRSTLALARGRGASGSLLLGTQLWEALLLAGAAMLVGLLTALLLVESRPDPLSPSLALAVGVAAVLLLVGASWQAARRPLGQLERDDTPVLRVAPRRLVIEMTIVGVAIGAAILLRQRGLTVGTPGTVPRFDPLLAAVPVLGGLAAGILALRLYPLPIRALSWLAARRRDLIPVLGLRTIGRHPAVANLPLLALMLTAAFGAFSSVIVSSLDRGQLDASYLNLGADYRIDRIGLGSLAPVADPAATPGVEAVAPGIIDPSADFAVTPGQRAAIYLVAVDPAAYQAVTAGTAAAPHWPDVFLADPGGSGLGTDENPIPAILSVGLPSGTPSLGPGATFHMRVAGQSMTFRLVEQRAVYPGLQNRSTFAVVPFNWVKAAFKGGPLPPSTVWLRGSESAAAPLQAAFANARDLIHYASRYDAYNAIHDAPLAAVIGTGYGLAVVVAAIYMALTVIGALVLSAARRTRDLAFLRTLGVTGPQSLALTVMEHAPPVLLAVIPGIGVGIAVAILCEPGLGLTTFVGAGGVPLFVDWPALALLVVALIGVVAAAVTAGTWLSRRARLVDSLRIGDD